MKRFKLKKYVSLAVSFFYLASFVIVFLKLLYYDLLIVSEFAILIFFGVAFLYCGLYYDHLLLEKKIEGLKGK